MDFFFLKKMKIERSYIMITNSPAADTIRGLGLASTCRAQRSNLNPKRTI